MLTKPDAPFNLANDINRSSGKTITIVWNNGAEDGGTPVIDYIVSYDSGLGTNVFTVLASAVTTQSYSVTQVTPGKTYVFKVQSRNAFGPSLFSDSVAILAAQTPDPPIAPVTSVSGTNILITWTAPFDNGSPITSYEILIQNSDDITYAMTPSCDGTDPTIRSARQCMVPVSVLLTSPFNHVYGNFIYATVKATNAFG